MIEKASATFLADAFLCFASCYSEAMKTLDFYDVRNFEECRKSYATAIDLNFCYRLFPRMVEIEGLYFSCLSILELSEATYRNRPHQ